MEIVSIINTALTVLVIFLVAVGALKGLSRGISRQAIRFVTIIISIIFSVIVAGFIGNSFIGQFDENSSQMIYDAIYSSSPELGDSLEWMLGVDASAIKYLVAIPFSLVICPIIFVPVFMFSSLLMMIVHAIVCGICGLSKKKNNAVTRLCGMILGAIQGLIVSAMILLPILGVGSAVSNAVAVLNEEAPDEESTITITQMYDDYIRDIAEHPLVKTLKVFGADITYKSIATVKIDGESMDMTDLVPDTAKIYAESTHLSGWDWKNLTEDNKASINVMVDTLLNNDYYASLTSGILKTIAQSYTNGAMPFEIEEPFDAIITEAVSIFLTSDTTNIRGDVDTLLNVYFILSDDGLFAAMEQDSDAMLEVLTKKNEDGTTTVNKVIDTIRANERTKPLVTLLAKLSISVMSNQTNIDSNITEAYDQIKDGLNTTLQITKDGKTEEEYLSEVSESIDNTLKANGIELESDVVDNMAKYVSDNFEAGKEITDDDITDIIISYYDAYLEYQENGTLPDELPLPESGNSDTNN